MSSTEEDVRFDSYRDIATFRGQRPLFYQQFGSYQGEWVLFALAGDDYLIYRDYYGSCSGCDSLEAANISTSEQALAFAEGYRPFCEIPRETARNLARNGTLKQVFPANFRESDWRDDLNPDELVGELETIIKLEEDLPVEADDAWRARSQETRRRVLERIDVEALIDTVIDVDGPDRLVAIRDEMYLQLKDASSDRRYFLRVPPEMIRVRQAKAWSFDMDENEYAPIVET